VTQSYLRKEIVGRRNRRHDRARISRRPCQICCGAIESTIPGSSPDTIALLRLDTDWFTSTYHELLHFWPSLVINRVMIIDDHGYWAGTCFIVLKLSTILGMTGTRRAPASLR
jgi:hypothetical protein